MVETKKEENGVVKMKTIGNFLTDEQIEPVLKDKIWVVSHGGVSSTYVRERVLGLQSPQNVIVPGTKKKFSQYYGNGGRLVHYPYPIKSGPKLAIYIFGDLLNSLISQIKRHPENSTFLHNTTNYHTYRYEQLQEDDDRFGIKKQVERFFTDVVDYPIILINFSKIHNGLFDNIRDYFPFADNKEKYEKRNRKSHFQKLSGDNQYILLETYGDLHKELLEKPAMMIRYPDGEKIKIDT